MLAVSPPEKVTINTFIKLYLNKTTAEGTPILTKKNIQVIKTEKIFKNSAINANLINSKLECAY